MIPRLSAALLAASLLLALSVGIAAAHAELVESDPADGETIQTPATLSATFSEGLRANGSSLVVRNAAGDEVASGGVSDDDPLMMTAELPAVPAGEFLVLWTAVSDVDGHVERGQYSFAVAAPATPSPSPTLTPTASPTGTPAFTPSPSPMSSPTASPSPSPSPPPIDDEPTGGMTDVLLALVLAGAVIGGLAIYLLRRR